MEKGRLTKGGLEWRPPGKRKTGRPKLTWAEGIKGMMGEKGLQEEDWTDRTVGGRRYNGEMGAGRWKHRTAC
jgi:hypothetical protein